MKFEDLNNLGISIGNHLTDAMNDSATWDKFEPATRELDEWEFNYMVDTITRTLANNLRSHRKQVHSTGEDSKPTST